MKYRSQILTLITFFNNQVVLADMKYICDASKSTGFIFDKSKQEWNVSNFSVTGSRYSMSINNVNNKDKYKLHNILYKETSNFTCGDINKHGELKCINGNTIFKYNKNTSRFIITQDKGYIESYRGSVLTPYIEIGLCLGL